MKLSEEEQRIVKWMKQTRNDLDNMAAIMESPYSHDREKKVVGYGLELMTISMVRYAIVLQKDA